MGRGGDLEAKVRKVLPKDEQIVAAMVGVYFSLFLTFKVVKAASASPPEPAAAPVVATASASGSESKFGFEPPTIEPDTFTAWSENAENWKKWEEFMASPKLELWLDGKL